MRMASVPEQYHVINTRIMQWHVVGKRIKQHYSIKQYYIVGKSTKTIPCG